MRVKDGNAVGWKTSEPTRWRGKSSGKALFQSVQTARGITRRTDVTVEMDGRIGVRIALESKKAQTLEGLRLVM